ncbi:MAG: phage tail assembly chaperone [Proteobacteria bacterium]|nr:phage tail assembly chaperone [Pseudomonadota bacterium]
MGQLRMSEEEFWSMTPRAFFNAIEGFESLRRTDLEVVRLQTLYSINTWAKTPITDPQALWKYPWEGQVKKVDVEELRKRGKELVKRYGG